MVEENVEQNVAEILCSLSSVSEPAADIVQDDLPEKESTKRKFERKKRRHEVVIFPLTVTAGFYAVPNGEIIQTYPPLLFEILGSGNTVQFRNWMLSVCHPEIEMVLEYSGEQNPYGPNNRQFFGVHHCTDFLLANLNSAPDITFSSFEPVKTKRDEITGCYFQTYASLAEMNRVMQVVDTVSTIDVKLVEQKQAEREKKARRKSGIKTTTSQTTSDLSTASNSSENLSDFNSPDSHSATIASDNYNATENTSEITTQTTINEDSAIDNMIQKLASFSLAPLEPERIKKTYHLSQVTYTYNTERKITRICNLFGVFDEKPTKKLNGIWC